MFDTDMKNEEHSLLEMLALFDGADKLNIKHRSKIADGKYVNTVTVNGNIYAYGNLGDTCGGELITKRMKLRFAKLALYKSLVKTLGINQPWGALTGIRPAKMAHKQLKETGEYLDFFKNTMLVSDEKIRLVEEILSAEKGVYDEDGNDTEFFVSIPFCPTRCEYCSFVSAEIGKIRALVPDYIDALVKEIRASKPLIKNLKSVYIGGGTPVSIGTEYLEKLLAAVSELIGEKKVEYTVEAGRPDAINEENLALLKKYGVTRVCVNPQTFNDFTLEKIGRKHTAKDVLDKFEMVKKFGFDVNMDLIAGLTGETLADFKYSLDKACSLFPEDITVHTLCLKAGSRLKEETEKLDVGDTPLMVEYAHKTLSENGYKPYYLYRQKYMAGNLENTGYCKDGKACVYNVAVMEETSDNVACGANAVSKRVYSESECEEDGKITRYGAPKDIATYIAKIDRIIADKAELFGKNSLQTDDNLL